MLLAIIPIGDWVGGLTDWLQEKWYQLTHLGEWLINSVWWFAIDAGVWLIAHLPEEWLVIDSILSAVESVVDFLYEYLFWLPYFVQCKVLAYCLYVALLFETVLLVLAILRLIKKYIPVV